MAVRTGIVNGSDLMLFVNMGTVLSPTWDATAHATSHTVDYGVETKERVTKDIAGRWKGKVITGMSCTIKCDALVSYDSTVGYDKFLELMKACEPVLLKFSPTLEQSGDKYEEGLFVITALSKSTQANEDASYSATMESAGEIVTKTKSA